MTNDLTGIVVSVTFFESPNPAWIAGVHRVGDAQRSAWGMKAGADLSPNSFPFAASVR